MAGDEFKISPVRLKETQYVDAADKEKDKEKELASKPSYNNVGGGPSIWNDHLAFTRTNGVSGDNGESATCFYS